MPPRLICWLLLVLTPAFALQAQTTSQPVASLERAVKAERGGWAGVLNCRAVKLGKPFYPALAHKAGASGEVTVQIFLMKTAK